MTTHLLKIGVVFSEGTYSFAVFLNIQDLIFIP